MRPPATPVPPRPVFLNDAAMVFLRTSGLAALLCVLYIAFGNERAGFILLGALSLASLAAGVTVVLAYRDEAAVLEAAPEGAPAVRPVRYRPLPAPSATPLAGAAAIALIAGGFLYGPSLTITGVVVGLITIFAIASVAAGEHRDHPVNLLPVAIPIVAFAVIGSFMFLMSRILLAVEADLSVVVAIGAALFILLGGFLVANKPQVPTRTLVRAAAGLSVLFAAGGLAAYGVGQRPEERKAGPPPQTVIAKNIAFEQKHLQFEAGADVTVDFKNEDTVPHNIDFTVDQAGAQTFYKQDPLPGPISATYKFTAPKAGEYFYHCDVHPNMTGTVSVTGTGGGEPGQAAAPTTAPGKSTATTAKERTATTKPAPAAGGGGGSGTSADLVAKGVEFDKKTLTFKANSAVVIHFDNKDPLPHNVDITTESGGNGATIFKEDPFSGPKEVDYRFTTPGPGRLYFKCDVHPNMTGTINVQ
jgi:plastocyanin